MKPRSWIALLVLTSVLGFGCGGGDGVSSSNEIAIDLSSYMPLNHGDRYLYAIAGGDNGTEPMERTTEPWTESRSFHREDVALVHREGLRWESVEHWIPDAGGGWGLAGIAHGDDSVWCEFSPPLAFPRSVEPRRTVRRSATSQDSRDTTGAPAWVVQEFSFEGFEEIVVPAGAFSNCARLVIVTSSSDPSLHDLIPAMKTVWLAPRIGVVKELSDHRDLELLSIAFNASTFVPLIEGATYDYVDLDTGEPPESVRKSVLPKTSAPGIPVVVIPIEEVVNGVLDTTVFATTDEVNGHRIHAEIEWNDDLSAQFAPAIGIPQGLVVGESRVEVGIVFVQGQGFSEAHRLETQITFDGLETIFVPAGRFDGCARIRTSTALWNGAGELIEAETVLYFFAPNVGLVKEIEPDSVAELVGTPITGS